MACRVFYKNELTTPKFTNLNMKALSPVMIMLSTAQIMSSVEKKNEKYKSVRSDMADLVINGGFLNEKAGALLENVSENGDFAILPRDAW